MGGVQALRARSAIMKSFQSRLGIAVAGFALLALPAFAGQRPSQDNASPAADRAVERGSGTGGGTAAARGGDGASAATPGSSVAPSSVSGGQSTAPSASAS